MVEITEREITALHDTHDKVIRIDTILEDMCKEVAGHQTKIRRIEIVLGALLGSGALGGIGVGINKLFGG